MTLKEQEVIMKVTVKEGIKGFSGKLSFGGTASAGTKKRSYLYFLVVMSHMCPKSYFTGESS